MHIELRGISKHFGEVTANEDVNLEIKAGEVLALLGENGAGKSTLMKILYGFYQGDSGEIVIDGTTVEIDTPRTAMALGIGMVFQQFNLIPALSVAENLMLAYPKSPWWQGRHRPAWSTVLENLTKLARDIDSSKLVRHLAIGEQQLVELAKVLNLNAQLVILDEPTAVLTPQESERLWALVRQLADSGRSVVLITHKFEDVEACADRVAIMRAGRLVEVADARGKTIDEMVTLMMGQHQVAANPSVKSPQKDIQKLWIKSISAKDRRAAIVDIELQLAPGEILGIAGVAGNGQRLLADAVAGLAVLDNGEVILDGEVVSRQGRQPVNPNRNRKIGYIPEQPLENGVASDLDLTTNLSLHRLVGMSFFPKKQTEQAQAQKLINEFNVRPSDPTRLAQDLSGGNLQKLVSARELSGTPSLVVACYPSMGLDILSTRAIYEQMFKHAERGACILWISEDLDDLLQYAHRIAVLSHGKITGILPAASADRQTIGLLMTGARKAA